MKGGSGNWLFTIDHLLLTTHACIQNFRTVASRSRHCLGRVWVGRDLHCYTLYPVVKSRRFYIVWKHLHWNVVLAGVLFWRTAFGSSLGLFVATFLRFYDLLWRWYHLLFLDWLMLINLSWNVLCMVFGTWALQIIIFLKRISTLLPSGVRSFSSQHRFTTVLCIGRRCTDSVHLIYSGVLTPHATLALIVMSLSSNKIFSLFFSSIHPSSFSFSLHSFCFLSSSWSLGEFWFVLMCRILRGISPLQALKVPQSFFQAQSQPQLQLDWASFILTGGPTAATTRNSYKEGFFRDEIWYVSLI